MMRLLISAMTTFLLAAPVTAATYSTTLSGANETVPNASTATGSGTLVLSSDSNFALVDLNWAGTSGPVAAGHAHCCAAPGGNAAVAIGFAPANATSGAYHAFIDLTQASTYTNGFRLANGGTGASARLAFLAGLTSGRVYYNLHSAVFPGGEIRGNLVQSAVPEPASWAMMIGGFGLVGVSLRRRREAVA